MSQLTIYHQLSVNYGLETSQIRAWKDPKTSAPRTTAYLRDSEVVTLVGRCINAIKTGHGSATLEQLRHSGGAKILPPPLPPLTANHVERKAPMDFMERALFIQNGNIKPGSKILVVTRIGGCGETQLVRKFIQIHEDRHAAIDMQPVHCCLFPPSYDILPPNAQNTLHLLFFLQSGDFWVYVENSLHNIRTKHCNTLEKPARPHLIPESGPVCIQLSHEIPPYILPEVISGKTWRPGLVYLPQRVAEDRAVDGACPEV